MTPSVAGSTEVRSVLGLQPAAYRPHALHDVGRTYTETNCWTDVVIELVAALGMCPEAMMGSAVTVDFELDQWTFFKPATEDLWTLYGLDVHEMQPTDLPRQAVERLALGQLLMPEVDSWWLPDTAGTCYHVEHSKTSVLLESVDPDAQVLRYLHNTGYHELSGADYRGVFGIDPARDAAAFPGYCELVRPGAGPRLDGAALHATARALLARHLTRRPADNPFTRFGERLAQDLPDLLAADLASYHTHAFSNARMAGSAYELLASHVRWLFGPESEDAEEVALALDDIVGGTKMLLFRLARRRTFDVTGVVDPMADCWERAMAGLDGLLGRTG